MAGIGLIAAAPVLNSRPELALGLVAGSVLPDLDALARVFGKRAFLRSHQTWSHAIPVQVAVSVLAGVIGNAWGADGLLLGAGLFVGLVIHTLLDFSNTLGVTLLAPFSRKRFCLEWVFFIDAFVLTLTFITAGYSLWLFYRNDDVPTLYAGIFFGTAPPSAPPRRLRARHRAPPVPPLPPGSPARGRRAPGAGPLAQSLPRGAARTPSRTSTAAERGSAPSNRPSGTRLARVSTVASRYRPGVPRSFQ